MSDWESLLRNALKTKFPAYAVDELISESSKVTSAVLNVTNNELIVDFTTNFSGRDYQLRLYRKDSKVQPHDLGVYRFTEGYDYPIYYWESIRDSKFDKPLKIFNNKEEIEKHFKCMISDHNSIFVQLITFHLRFLYAKNKSK